MPMLLDSLTAPSAAKRRRAIPSEEDQYLDVLHPDDLVLGFHFLEGVTHASNAVTAWASWNEPTAIMEEGAGGATRRPTLGADGITLDGGDELLLNQAGLDILDAVFAAGDAISVVYIGTGDTELLAATAYYVRMGNTQDLTFIGKLSNEDVRGQNRREGDQYNADNGTDEVADYGARAITATRNGTAKLHHLSTEFEGDAVGDQPVGEVGAGTVSFGSGGNQAGFITCEYKAVLFYRIELTTAECAESALIADDTPGV